MLRASFLLILLMVIFHQELQARLNLLRKPNIVIVMSDEENYTPYGWREEVAEWGRKNLPARQKLKDEGLQFHRHHTSATACTPSRAVFFTGQYPMGEKTHGITQTDGFGKRLGDPGITHLHENEVPTIGNWLLEGGFEPRRVSLIGKWHLSNSEIVENGQVLQILDKNFRVIDQNVEMYRQANKLAAFGFSAIPWVGPEPHGALEQNSATYRDPLYLIEFKKFLAEQRTLNQQERQPFFSVLTLVDPHDYVLALVHDLAGKMNIPPEAFAPPQCFETDHLDLSKEASVHADYKKTYPKLYCWDWLMKWFYEGDQNIRRLRQFYYQLLQRSDRSLAEVFASLQENEFLDDTIVIFTSDHGDYLGRRGGQQQKWHGLYAEVTHVPLFLWGKGIEKGDINQFTVHADILPTIMGILDIDEESARQRLLAAGFQRVPKLPGIDLSPLIFGNNEYRRQNEDFDRVIYTMTKDEISRGQNSYSAAFVNTLPRWILPLIPSSTFKPIDGNRHVEGIRFYENFQGQREEYYFTLYTDPDKKKAPEHRLYRVASATNPLNKILRTPVEQVIASLRPSDPFEINDLSADEPAMVGKSYLKLDALRKALSDPDSIEQKFSYPDLGINDMPHYDALWEDPAQWVE